MKHELPSANTLDRFLYSLLLGRKKYIDQGKDLSKDETLVILEQIAKSILSGTTAKSRFTSQELEVINFFVKVPPPVSDLPLSDELKHMVDNLFKILVAYHFKILESTTTNTNEESGVLSLLAQGVKEFIMSSGLHTTFTKEDPKTRAIGDALEYYLPKIKKGG